MRYPRLTGCVGLDSRHRLNNGSSGIGSEHKKAPSTKPRGRTGCWGDPRKRSSGWMNIAHIAATGMLPPRPIRFDDLSYPTLRQVELLSEGPSPHAFENESDNRFVSYGVKYEWFFRHSGIFFEVYCDFRRNSSSSKCDHFPKSLLHSNISHNKYYV